MIGIYASTDFLMSRTDTVDLFSIIHREMTRIRLLDAEIIWPGFDIQLEVQSVSTSEAVVWTFVEPKDLRWRRNLL